MKNQEQLLKIVTNARREKQHYDLRPSRSGDKKQRGHGSSGERIP